MEEFTPEEVAEAAQEAHDNWDWAEEARYHGEKFAEAEREALAFDADYVGNVWALTDGKFRLPKEFRDIWDFLYEFARATAASALANAEFWKQD